MKKANYLDKLNKSIETAKRNIMAENKRPQPDYRVIKSTLDRLAKLSAELEALQAINVDSLVMSRAKQAVYVSCRTIHAKTGDKQLEAIMLQLYMSNRFDDTMSLSSDLIGVAALAIVETAQASNLVLESFLTCEYYDMQYMQYTNKLGQEAYHTPFSWTLTQINKSIHAQKTGRGRKSVTNYTVMRDADCHVYDAVSGELTGIETFEARQVATASSYAIELVSLEAVIDGAGLDASFYDIERDCSMDLERLYMCRNLSPQEKQVFDMLQSGLKQVEIADLLQKKMTTINTVVNRIRTKIANLQCGDSYAYNYDVVNKYRTK